MSGSFPSTVANNQCPKLAFVNQEVGILSSAISKHYACFVSVIFYQLSPSKERDNHLSNLSERKSLEKGSIMTLREIIGRQRKIREHTASVELMLKQYKVNGEWHIRRRVCWISAHSQCSI